MCQLVYSLVTYLTFASVKRDKIPLSTEQHSLGFSSAVIKGNIGLITVLMLANHCTASNTPKRLLIYFNH